MLRGEWKMAVGFAGAILLLVAFPIMLNTLFGLTGWRWEQLTSPWTMNKSIAPLFTPEVQHWAKDIDRWATEYSIDPNLLATIMQIESCGHPTVYSNAGAQGLFQVMPFHFSPGEQSLDPDTNAMRGAKFVQWCSDYTDGNVGLTLACYNGGGLLTQRSFHTWPEQTKRYYLWGVGIYGDAIQNSSQSQTLDSWLNAGGSRLCNTASSVLGLSR
jgi:soluble lytic murein transglycosylase-like protein